MSGTVREPVFAEKSEEEKVLISLDIEDDKLFLLHFIIGNYFGPDLHDDDGNKRKQSAFQIQASSNLPTKEELSASLMKRAELERVYYYVLRNADPSDLYPLKLHPESRIRNQYKLIKSIVFINDPDTSCMREDCVDRFKLLTGLQSFTLSLNIDVTEVDDEPLETLGTCLEGGPGNHDESEPTLEVNGVIIADAQAEQMMGLMDIGECADAYLFRVSLPGVKRDERHFSCEVEDNGRVLVRGVTTTGEKQVHRYSQVFKMKTHNLCPPGHFSVSFHLPGPVHPQEFTGSFGTDGIFEGTVMKKLQNQTV
ncbi:increased DNA methylation 2 isoform X2 [Brassica rapa]|uniref:increased DNA methylation 2 isoform X2 n=1 Tax=Brassica campestris TaxID=3711 RepID=UPI0004F1D36A|nr:increased DNA methylation 2 isoform X2 [Brassica rapa]